MSNEGTKYILDSNVFIEAFRRYYSFDIAPSFWDFLSSNCDKKLFIVIDKVYNELINGGDKLSEWVKKELTNKTVRTDDDANIIKWYKGSEVQRLRRQADSRVKRTVKLYFDDCYLLVCIVQKNSTIFEMILL